MMNFSENKINLCTIQVSRTSYFSKVSDPLSNYLSISIYSVLGQRNYETSSYTPPDLAWYQDM